MGRRSLRFEVKSSKLGRTRNRRVSVSKKQILRAETARKGGGPRFARKDTGYPSESGVGGVCSHGEGNMNLSEFRFIRQAAVLALAGSLLAISCVARQGAAQQPAAQPGQQAPAAPAATQEAETKTVPTPGIPSTGFAGQDRYRASRIAIFTDDYGQLARYRAADEALSSAAPAKDRVVFFGDSITDMWKLENNFPGKPYVNRGIGGQTTAQMLVRFRQDVIDLQPKAVVILAGTNDIAGNTGPMRNEDIEADLATMAELAKSHGIAVVFASILPVHNYTAKAQDFFAQRPGARILEVNRWLKEYCEKDGIVYLDYFSALADEKGLLKKELAEDGLHPNDEGYKLMAPLAEAAVAKATAGSKEKGDASRQNR
jgi:acyl-CoA thioesterase I